jgi:uncharacterized RDD family membrane protein YckC
MDEAPGDYGIVCPECRATIAFGESECASCGYAFSRPAPTFVQPSVAPQLPTSPRVIASTPVAPVEAVPGLADFYASRRAAQHAGVVYAGFWRRWRACCVDSVVLVGVSIVANLVLLSFGPSDAGTMGTLVVLAIVLVGSTFYDPLMTSGRGRGTVGKRAVGVVVTDVHGNRISFGRAFARYLLRTWSFLLLGTGYLPLVFRADNRALHDLIAGTVVTRS